MSEIVWLVTFACEEHKHDLFEMVKWYLVFNKLWYPEGLSMDLCYEDRKCFCGKLATYIIKYKIPLKVKV